MTHMYFSARAEGIRTFRHALRAAYRTAISAAQILVTYRISAIFLIIDRPTLVLALRTCACLFNLFI